MDFGFFQAIAGLNYISGDSHLDDDFVDRINRYWTSMLLIFLAIILSAKQFVGSPIKCWAPKEYPGSWVQYAENYCWIENTYWVPNNSSIPDDHNIRKETEIAYYQWVPFFLAIIGLMYYIPCMMWRLLNWQTGINITSLVSSACESVQVDADTRKVNVARLAHLLENNLMRSQDAQFSWAVKLRRFLSYFTCCARRNGNYLTNLYLLHKILYIVNVIGQFYLLNSFLGTDHLYGWSMAKDLVMGREWHESGHFPRVTMCDFKVRVLANVQRHTVQCVLMINLFNEKVFIFIWFWFLFVAVVTCISFFLWAWRMVPSFKRDRFVRRYLKEVANESSLKVFTTKFLRSDGVFLLRLISQNAGDIVAKELITDLWNNHQERSRPPKVLPNEDDSSCKTDIQHYV